MSNKLYEEEDVRGIATAIRNKTGSTGTYTISQMASAIDAIETGSGGGGDSIDLINEFISSDLSGDIVTNATTIRRYVFENCKITSISGNNVTMVNDYAFYSCKNLTSLSLPALTTAGTYVFYGCASIKSISLPLLSSIGNNFFYGCSSLEVLYLPSATSIKNQVFVNCGKLKDIWLNNDSQVCTYGTSNTAYDPKNADLKIHVPAALLDQYKTATNWVRLASKFVAIEEGE